MNSELTQQPTAVDEITNDLANNTHNLNQWRAEIVIIRDKFRAENRALRNLGVEMMRESDPVKKAEIQLRWNEHHKMSRAFLDAFNTLKAAIRAGERTRQGILEKIAARARAVAARVRRAAALRLARRQIARLRQGARSSRRARVVARAAAKHTASDPDGPPRPRRVSSSGGAQ